MLEILILTVGIYYAFRFIRGTRGAPVVTGFLVVLLAFVLVSFLLKLKVLQYLLSAFTAYFVLAVLVIFQPELRRMLAELGNLPLFTTAHEQRENIEVIIQTVERLADVMRPKSYLLAFFTANEKVSEVQSFAFRLVDHKTILLAERGMRPSGQVFNNRNLEKLFGKFESVKFFLTRENLREVIVRR